MPYVEFDGPLDDDKKAASSFVPFDGKLDAPAKPARERTWGEALGDTASQLGEGVNNILGAVPNLVAPEGDAAKFFNRGAKSWRDAQSDPIKQRTAAADVKISAAGEEGVIAQVVEAAKQYSDDPVLAARFVFTNLPSLVPGIGAAKIAQAAALARGATAIKAASIATTAAGATNAALNAGGARGEAFEDIKATLIKQGMSPAEAEQKAIADSRLPAAIGAATGFISGKTGLEGAIAGTASRTAGGAARRAIGSSVAELAGEQLEEVAPKLATNYQASQYDGRAITKDVGRTMVETAIGSGPGAGVGAWAAARNPQEAGPAPAPTPIPAPAARIEPSLSDIGNAETVDDAIRAAANLISTPSAARADLPTSADIDALEDAYEDQPAAPALPGIDGLGRSGGDTAPLPAGPVEAPGLTAAGADAAGTDAALPGAGGTTAVLGADNAVDAQPALTETGNLPELASSAESADWFAFPESTGTLAIPRAEMPQIKAEHRGAMTRFMNARGVTHEQIDIDAAELKPTQAEFSMAKVQQAKDYQGGNRSILVSSDGHVLDGHHQWLAAVEDGQPVKAIRLNAPIAELVKLAHEFPSSTKSDGQQDGEQDGEQYIYRGQPENFRELQTVGQSDGIDNILIGKGIFTTTSEGVARSYGKNVFKFKAPKSDKVLNLSDASEAQLRALVPESFFAKEYLGLRRDTEVPSTFEVYRRHVERGDAKKAEDLLMEAMADQHLPGDVSWTEVRRGDAMGKSILPDQVREKISAQMQAAGYDFVSHKGGVRVGGEGEHTVYIALNDKALESASTISQEGNADVSESPQVPEEAGAAQGAQAAQQAATGAGIEAGSAAPAAQGDAAAAVEAAPVLGQGARLGQSKLDQRRATNERQDAAVAAAAASLEARKKTGGQAARDRVAKENPLLAFLGTHGINLDERSDTGGEKRKNAMLPGFGPIYRRSGKRIDELATLAVEAGFLTSQDVEDATDNGGTRKLADLIQRAVHGREVIKPAASEPSARDADAQIIEDAERMGIDTSGKSGDQLYDEVVAAHAAQFSDAEANLASAIFDDIPLDGGADSSNLTDEDLDAIFGIQAQPAEGAGSKTESDPTAPARGSDPVAEKTGQSESAEVRDTRGTGVRFHGTSRALLGGRPNNDYAMSGDNRNIYGQGFYTTDAADISEGYMRKGKGGAPTLYEITERGDVKLYDMEQPMSDEVRAMAERAMGDEFPLEDIDSKPITTLRELFDEYRDDSASNGLSRDEVQETFDAIRYNLEQMGYKGYRHIGGLKTKKQPHDVRIYWAPEDDIDVKQSSLDQYRGEDPVLSSYSAADVVAREEAAAARDKGEAAERARADAARKKEAERRDIDARMDASAENFQLGQSADDSLSGQEGLRFSVAGDPVIPSAFYSRVDVQVDVWDKAASSYKSTTMPADQALDAVRGDIDTYRAMIACMKG